MAGAIQNKVRPDVGTGLPRPTPPLSRGRFLAAAALGLVLVFGAAVIADRWMHAGRMHPWKAASVFAAMMAIAAGQAHSHPFQRLGPANLVTMARAAVVAFVAGLIGEPAVSTVAWGAVLVVVPSLFVDGVDGWLARRSGLASAFGARFDMETDALLVMVLSILAWRHDKAGAWILLGGLMRYGIGAARQLLPWMRRPLTPTRRAQTIAILHLVGLTVAVAPIIPSPLSDVAAALTLAALMWSFGMDVRRLWRGEA